MIEIIDVERQKLLVSQLVPQYLMRFIDGDVVGLRADDDGVRQIDIWRVRF